MDYRKQNDRFLRIKENNIIHQLAWKEIVYIHCDNHRTTVHLTNPEKCISCTTRLQSIQENLGYGFIQISRNTIANIRNMRSCTAKNEKSMTMTNGDKLKITRSRWRELMKFLRE